MLQTLARRYHVNMSKSLWNTLSRATLICRRELGDIFGTPRAYIILVLFQLLNGLFFCAIVHSGAAGNLAYLYRNVGLVMLVMVPAIAMGSFVREKQSGTVELLLTSPLTAFQLVLGKASAYLTFLLVMCLTTLQYPFMLNFFTPVDEGRVFTGTLGLMCLGCAMMSLGLFASALTNHQVSACLLAATLGLVFWCAQSLVSLVLSAPLAVVRSVSFYERMVTFTVGLLDSGDCAFFLIFSFIVLTLCLRIVEGWRWR